MSTPAPPSFSPYRWLMIILGLVIVAMMFYRWGNFAPPVSAASVLPRIRTVPPFNLTERSGKIISNHDLAGKIWVADFIYTTCPGPCPLVTTSMARVQNALEHDPRVQLVTFTVDPQTDTPAILAKYADQYGADPNRWWFLTGPEKPLYDLIQNGFLQVVQDNRGQAPQERQSTVTHSTYFVLVDADGTMRGSFDGVGTDGRADLLKSIRILEKEEEP